MMAFRGVRTWGFRSLAITLFYGRGGVYLREMRSLVVV